MNCEINSLSGKTVMPRHRVVIARWPRRIGISRARGIRGSVRLIAVMLAVLLSAGGIAAAGTNKAKVDVKPVLTLGVSEGFITQNPAIATSGSETVIRNFEYAFLFRLNSNGTAGPELATSWHYVGKGNKTFEVTLIKDARFSDGEQVNAQAVKGSLLNIKKAAGPYSGWINIGSIQTIGEWTDIIHLATPNPSVPYLLSDQLPLGAIVAPKAIANQKLLANNTYGAGPYVGVASESVAGDHYTLVPNKFYYDPSAIHFSKIVAKVITQPSTMLEALESGEIQFGSGDPTTAKAATKAGLTVDIAPYGNVAIQIIDRDGVLDKALASPLVREALNYAINRKAIEGALLGKYGTPSSEPLTLDGWVPSLKNYFPYDPAKAKQLLAQAGYPNGFTFNDVAGGAAGEAGAPISEAVAEDLAAVGVTMNVTDAMTDPVWHSDIVAKTYASWENIWNALPMEITFSSFLVDPSNLNVFNVPDDPVLKRLATKALTSSNATSILQQMTRRIMTQGIFLTVANYDQIWYATKSLNGASSLGFSLAVTFPSMTGLALKS